MRSRGMDVIELEPGMSLKLVGVSLVRFLMTDAVIDRSVLTGSTFIHSNFSRSLVRRSSAPGVSFEDCDLRGTDWYESGLTGATFIRSDCSAASFAGCVLTGARFIDCVLTGCDFSDSIFTGGEFSRVVASDVRFDRAILTGAKFRDVQFGSADFSGAVLTRTDLSGADLQAAKNLTVDQLRLAVCDLETALPDGLSAQLQGRFA